MKISGVYKITNSANGKFYIGGSVNIKSRWRTHKSQLNKGKHQNPAMQKDWQAYGGDVFTLEVIETCVREQVLLKEQAAIQSASVKENPLCYNVSSIASSAPLGRVIGEAARRKIGDANRGHKHSPEARKLMSDLRKGKALTENQKQAISLSHMGKSLSMETRQKIGNAIRGIKRSEETKAKLRDSHIGKTISDEQRRKMAEGNHKKVLCVTTGQVFQSIKEAAANVGVNYTNITNCCRGRQQHAGRCGETGQLLKWAYYA